MEPDQSEAVMEEVSLPQVRAQELLLGHVHEAVVEEVVEHELTTALLGLHEAVVEE
jgi:hypothetical protein